MSITFNFERNEDGTVIGITTDTHEELLEAILKHECNTKEIIEALYERLEDLDEQEEIELFYRLDNGLNYRLEVALDELTNDGYIFYGSPVDYAEETTDLHDVPEHVKFYIDYKRMARDYEMGGGLDEFTYKGSIYCYVQ